MRRHSLRFKRGMGQCFLVEDDVLEAIARAATNHGEKLVVEIGAGLGTLTRRLAQTGANVVAIERDRDLVPVLSEEFRGCPNVRILEGDALAIQFGDLGTVKPAVAGNLPYCITSPLLFAFFEQRQSIGTVTIMIQKEVADRLLASPDTREYGSLSVLFQVHADMEHLFNVDPGAFQPSPKVHSTVIQLSWLASPRVAIDDAVHFQNVVRTAFGQRRKTLRNSLRVRFDEGLLRAAAAAAGIELQRRAETLTALEFSKLARALAPSAQRAR